MLKTCMCNKPECKTCDCSTYPKSKPVECKNLKIRRHCRCSDDKDVEYTNKKIVVNFDKLLETQDEAELKDILQTDIRPEQKSE
jgi:hypothetical protein